MFLNLRYISNIKQFSNNSEIKFKQLLRCLQKSLYICNFGRFDQYRQSFEKDLPYNNK